MNVLDKSVRVDILLTSAAIKKKKFDAPGQNASMSPSKSPRLALLSPRSEY